MNSMSRQATLKMDLSCCCDDAHKVFVLQEYLQCTGENALQLLPRLVQEGALKRPDLRLVKYLQCQSGTAAWCKGGILCKNDDTVDAMPIGHPQLQHGRCAVPYGICRAPTFDATMPFSPIAARGEQNAVWTPFALLTDELLHLVLDQLIEDDVCCFMLVCSDCHRVTCASHLRVRTSAAATVASIPRFQWALAMRCPWFIRWGPPVCERVAQHGKLEVLQWVRSNRCAWDAGTCSAAAGRGHLAMLKWARKEGCPVDVTAWSAAAEHGHLDVLQWLHEQGCASNATVCAAAAGAGRLHVLKWLRDHGVPWNASTCSAAASRGQLEVLQWARQNGCAWSSPWNASTFWSAVDGGHEDVLQWLRANDCPR